MDTIALDVDLTALQELPETELVATDDLANSELGWCWITCLKTCGYTVAQN